MLKLGIILIAVIVVGVTQIRAAIRRKGLTRDLKKAKTDLAYASQLLDSLEFFYGGFEYSDYQSIVDKIKRIQKNQRMGAFYPTDLIEVGIGNFLCPAEREIILYKEHTDEPYSGGYELIIFGIIVNQEKSKVEVYSDIFGDQEDKNNKTEFAMGIKTYLGL